MRSINLLIRQAWGLFFFYSGLYQLKRFYNNVIGERVTIVTYHRVTDQDINQIENSLPFLMTTLESFKKQLRFFKTWYKVISFEELHAFQENNSIPWNALILTFDDGYEDNVLNAYPLLAQAKLPATFFITVDKIGASNCKPFWWDRVYSYFSALKRRDDKKIILQELNSELTGLYHGFDQNPSALFAKLNKWDSSKIEKLLDELNEKLQLISGEVEQANSIMNWEQINSIRQYVQIGSHTRSHCNLLTVNSEQKLHEIAESKKIIEEKIKKVADVLSYPCGNVDDNLKHMVEAAGYRFAVTTESGINDMHDNYALKRINIWEGSCLAQQGKFSKGYFAYKLTGF